MKTVNKYISALSLSLLLPFTGLFADEERTRAKASEAAASSVVDVPAVISAQGEKEEVKAGESWFTAENIKKGLVLAAKIAAVVAFYNPTLIPTALSLVFPVVSAIVNSPIFATLYKALKAIDLTNTDSTKFALFLKVLDTVGYSDTVRNIVDFGSSIKGAYNSTSEMLQRVKLLALPQAAPAA